MQDGQIASAMAQLNALKQIGEPRDMNALQQHIVELQVRTSDIAVQIGRLREQQSQADAGDRLRLDKTITELQHENAVTVADLQMSERRLSMLMAETAVPPQPDALIDRSMIEETAAGVFLLMIPIAFALARRIWVRSGPRARPVVDLESSPRLQRLEEAIESIAIEVERIGEAQRFATKLLTERPEPAMNRAVPGSAPIVRKAPGTITPH